MVERSSVACTTGLLHQRLGDRVPTQPGHPRPQPEVHGRCVLRLQPAHPLQHAWGSAAVDRLEQLLAGEQGPVEVALRSARVRRRGTAGIRLAQPSRAGSSAAPRSRSPPACGRGTARSRPVRRARRSASTNASTSGSATSAGAAALQPGRRPLRVSP